MTAGNTVLEYVYIYDPSHAWFMVPLRDVEFSMVTPKISWCSYRSKSHAYLEEDCDGPRFLEAMKKLGFTVKIREKHVDNFDIVIRKEKLTYFKLHSSASDDDSENKPKIYLDDSQTFSVQ